MMRFWLVLALVSGSVALTWHTKIDSLTPRKGRHRGAGRARRTYVWIVNSRGRPLRVQRMADHAGRTLLDVWWALNQATCGYVAVGRAAVPSW